MELIAGDKIIVDNDSYISELLVVSAMGFNLKDWGDSAHYIVVNPKFGSMESYHESLEEIKRDYKILRVIQNDFSVERMKLRKEG